MISAAFEFGRSPAFKSGYPLVPIVAGGVEYGQRVLERQALCFRSIIEAEVRQLLHPRKPERALGRQGRDNLFHTRNQLVVFHNLVDESCSNERFGGNELAGATAVGMRAVLLAGPDWHYNRSFSTWRGDANWAGPTLTSLTELSRPQVGS